MSWNPCPIMDSIQFYELGTSRMINRGNFFAEIERNSRDEPIAVWPIHNSRVVPFWTDAGEIEWHVMTSEPTGSNQGYGWRYFVLPDRDMFNLVGFGALSGNGIMSDGVLANAREDIALDLAAQQYGGSFFGSGGRPSGVVEHPGYISDEAKRGKFRKDLNDVHAGREGWNKIGVLWEGAKWKEISANPEDAQFVETRGYSSKTLCRWYNVPPAVVQIFDDYKFATVDAMIRQFVVLTVRADAVRWERAIKRQLLSVRDVETGALTSAFRNEDLIFEFLLNSLLRGDPKAQAETNAIKLQNGVMNPDEWRAQDNENPLPGGIGQQYLFPLNYTTLSRMVNGDPTTTSSSGDGSQQKLPEFDRMKFAEQIDGYRDRNGSKSTVAVGFQSGPAESQTTEQPCVGHRDPCGAKGAIVATMRRLVRVEQQWLNRTWSKWSAESAADIHADAAKWYGKHQQLISDALWPVLVGWMDGSDTEANATAIASQVAGDYCAQRLSEESQAVKATITKEAAEQLASGCLDSDLTETICAAFAAGVIDRLAKGNLR